MRAGVERDPVARAQLEGTLAALHQHPPAQHAPGHRGMAAGIEQAIAGGEHQVERCRIDRLGMGWR